MFNQPKCTVIEAPKVAKVSAKGGQLLRRPNFRLFHSFYLFFRNLFLVCHYRLLVFPGCFPFSVLFVVLRLDISFWPWLLTKKWTKVLFQNLMSFLKLPQFDDFGELWWARKARFKLISWPVSEKVSFRVISKSRSYTFLQFSYSIVITLRVTADQIKFVFFFYHSVPPIISSWTRILERTQIFVEIADFVPIWVFSDDIQGDFF